MKKIKKNDHYVNSKNVIYRVTGFKRLRCQPVAKLIRVIDNKGYREVPVKVLLNSKEWTERNKKATGLFDIVPPPSRVRRKVIESVERYSTAESKGDIPHRHISKKLEAKLEAGELVLPIKPSEQSEPISRAIKALTAAAKTIRAVKR